MTLKTLKMTTWGTFKVIVCEHFIRSDVFPNGRFSIEYKCVNDGLCLETLYVSYTLIESASLVEMLSFTVPLISK
jgi:hypothetical protein